MLFVFYRTFVLFVPNGLGLMFSFSGEFVTGTYSISNLLRYELLISGVTTSFE